MNIPKMKTCIGLSLCLLFPVLLFGQEKTQQDAGRSCKAFVGKFYSWYLKLKNNSSPSRTSDLALKARPYFFNTKLAQALREDSLAQDRAGSDLVSLDADPFLGGDGPAESYSVGLVTFKNGKCRAEVYGARPGTDGKTPEVIPALELRNGHWSFLDFYFPSPSDPKGWSLLGELKALQESRKKYGIDKQIAHAPYFQMSGEQRQKLIDSMQQIQLGESLLDVEALLGKPDFVTLIAPKKKPKPIGQVLKYYVLRYDSRTVNERDELVHLTFDASGNLIRIYSNVTGIPNKP